MTVVETRNLAGARSSPHAGHTIRSRVPLRLGLADGGTDLSPYSEIYGGAVLNCTIDRYAYAFISPRTDDKIAFRARDLLTDELHDLAPAIAPTSGLLLHRGVYNRMVSEFCGGEPRDGRKPEALARCVAVR